ncbi:cytochrome P450 1A1-like isoform X1 [Littorina saxatilis]|uniref:Cytochrome P450 n=1 Tax=Littorina saxatilis TaxID=31220 RepID=A0AAN9FXS2_9CAEN
MLSPSQGVLTFAKGVSNRLSGSSPTQALLVGTLVGFLAYVLAKKRYRLPPGPWAWPLVGNLSLTRDDQEAFYVKLRRLAVERYGPVITVHLGTVRCVTLNSVEVITEALVQKGADFAGRPYQHSLHEMTDGCKNVSFADYGPGWKLRRKLALQAIRHYMRGVQMENAVHEVVAVTADKMLSEPGAFDPQGYTSLLMFRILDSIFFGQTKPRDCPPPERVMDIVEQFANESKERFLEDVVPLVRFCPTPRFRRAMKILDQFTDYVRKNIEEHRKSFTPGNIRDLTDSILLAQIEAARADGKDTMEPFSDTHVVRTITDIFAAGIETSRMTLHWALLFLAGHPKVQTRMQAEIDAATGPRLPQLADKPNLPYCEATLYEVMRLSPVAPTSLPHKTMCDTTVGGYDVPKNTLVLVNLWAAMHDPDKWEQPEEFKPERFLDAEGQLSAKQESWMPFSTGRRSCIGESVVKPELVLILACLLKTLSVSLAPGQEYRVTTRLVSLFMNPPLPYSIAVTPRNK